MCVCVCVCVRSVCAAGAAGRARCCKNNEISTSQPSAARGGGGRPTSPPPLMNWLASRATSSSASASARTSDPVGAVVRAGVRPKEAAEKGSGVNEEEEEGGDKGACWTGRTTGAAAPAVVSCIDGISRMPLRISDRMDSSWRAEACRSPRT